VAIQCNREPTIITLLREGLERIRREWSLRAELIKVIDINHDDLILNKVINDNHDVNLSNVILLSANDNNLIMKLCAGKDKDYLSFREATLKRFLKIIPNTKIDCKNKDGDTALLLACKSNQVSLINLLLQHKASPLVMNNDDDTPLLLVCEFNQVELVRLFLQQNASPLSMNKKGKSPSSVTKNETIKRLLRGEDVPMAPSVLKAGGGAEKPQLSSVFSFATQEYGPAPKAIKRPPSTSNMLIDKNPPTAFSDMKDWMRIRDLLWLSGVQYKKSYEEKGSQLEVKDKKYWIYQYSRHMELMQANYSDQMSVVGSKARCTEAFLEYNEPENGWPQDGGHNITTADKLKQECITSKYSGIINDLKTMNHFSNRANHLTMVDIKPEDKPVIIDAAYRVSEVFWELIQEECPDDARRAIYWYESLSQCTEVDLFLRDKKYNEQCIYFKDKGFSTLNEFKDFFSEFSFDDLKQEFKDLQPGLIFTLKRLLSNLTDVSIASYELRAQSI